MSITCKCDSCGQEKTVQINNTVPSDWVSLRLNTTGRDSYKYQGSVKDICNNCIHKYNLQKKSDEEETKDAADRLWDLFTELAEETLNDMRS